MNSYYVFLIDSAAPAFYSLPLHAPRPILAPAGPRAQPVADDALPSGDVGLDQGAPAVPGRLLPAQATAFRDEVQVPVAPRRRGLGRAARHRVRAWWDDDLRTGMPRRDRGVDVVAVERAV